MAEHKKHIIYSISSSICINVKVLFGQCRGLNFKPKSDQSPVTNPSDRFVDVINKVSTCTLVSSGVQQGLVIGPIYVLSLSLILKKMVSFPDETNRVLNSEKTEVLLWSWGQVYL